MRMFCQLTESPNEMEIEVDRLFVMLIEFGELYEMGTRVERRFGIEGPPYSVMAMRSERPIVIENPHDLVIGLEGLQEMVMWDEKKSAIDSPHVMVMPVEKRLGTECLHEMAKKVELGEEVGAVLMLPRQA